MIVSINGGGDAEGAGGGINQISITAGGTVRTVIDAKSLQGTPSFIEARSRCGGPITLVIDESGSIGQHGDRGREARGDGVRQGGRRYAGDAAGRAVRHQEQHPRQHRLAPLLRHDQAGRRRHAARGDQPDCGRTATRTGKTRCSARSTRPTDRRRAMLPETVVFFTDGVPTDERSRRSGSARRAAGRSAGARACRGRHRPARTYSQVGFNRADFISNKFRRSVRMIGVGVGADIVKNSTWISDPGTGYRLTWERGSYSHVKDTSRRPPRRRTSCGPDQASKNGPWTWVNQATYTAAPSKDNRATMHSRRMRAGRTSPSLRVQGGRANPIEHDQHGRRQWRSTTTSSITSAPVSTVEFNANSTNPLYRTVTKTWAAGPDWEPWTGIDRFVDPIPLDEGLQLAPVHGLRPGGDGGDEEQHHPRPNDRRQRQWNAGEPRRREVHQRRRSPTCTPCRTGRTSRGRWRRWRSVSVAARLTLQTKARRNDASARPVPVPEHQRGRFDGGQARSDTDRRHHEPAVLHRNVRLRRAER